jgi:hypothetical protein
MLTHWVHYVDPFGKKKASLFSSRMAPIILSSDLSIHTSHSFFI